MPAGDQNLKKPWAHVTFKCRIGSGTFALDRFRGLFCGNLHVIWKWVPHIECLQPKVPDRSTNPKFKEYINIRGVLYTLGLAHRMPPKSSKMSSFTCSFRFFFCKKCKNMALKDCINWLFHMNVTTIKYISPAPNTKTPPSPIVNTVTYFYLFIWGGIYY